MADRGVENNFRQSINKIAEQEGISTAKPIGETLADIGQEIIRKNQLAKTSENFSKAQLEVNQLHRQFQTEYGHDPFNKEGLSKLKQNRDSVYKKYGSEISPFHRGEYNLQIQNLDLKSKGLIDTFGYEQARKNTVRSINDGIANNLSQASLDGENGVDLKTAMLNFSSSKESLMSVSNGVLNQNEANELVKNFDEDYLKMYLSGRAAVDPIAALDLMESKEVQGFFSKREEYTEMKDAIKSKALNVQNMAIEKEVISNLRKESELFNSNKPLSYADLKKFSNSMSEPAQAFFLKKSGYVSPKSDKDKLSNSDKIQVKAGLIDNISRLTKEGNVTLDNDIAQLQENIFDAMNKDAISQKEGFDLINQLIEPQLQDKESRIEDFATGKWNPFKEDTGFLAVEDFYKDQIEVKPKGDKKLVTVSSTLNNVNKANLFDFYFQGVKAEAAKKGVTVGGLKNLDYEEKKAAYQRASDFAINEFKKTNSPLVLRLGIPQQAISFLIENPQLSDSFDQMYGTGSANRILGR
jgi:hypothetical protein